jgi:hypothetical protein
MGLRLVSWLVLAAIAVSGCVGRGGASEPTATPPPSPTATVTLSIANYTTIAVTLVVNGSVVEVVPPGGYQDPIKVALPALPWTVETRSPSGRDLSSMTVRPGDVWQTSYPGGGGAAHGDAVRVDLSCGRIDVWSGPPLLGPPPGPGTSGDCA